MNMLTHNEIIDKVIEGIKAQNAFAQTEIGCQYCTTGGNRCAVGLLLPKEVAQQWEAKGLDDTSVDRIALEDWGYEDLKKAGIDADAHMELLITLQATHDHCAAYETVDSFIREVERLKK